MPNYYLENPGNYEISQSDKIITIMKKIILSITLFFLILTAFGQANSPALSKNYYLNKDKSQKTVAWIMLGAGLAMGATALLLGNKQINDDPFSILENTGPIILLFGGMGTTLVSIPFIIFAAKNKRRAASVSFGTRRNLFLQQNTSTYSMQPSVTLKIGL